MKRYSRQNYWTEPQRKEPVHWPPAWQNISTVWTKNVKSENEKHLPVQLNQKTWEACTRIYQKTKWEQLFLKIMAGSALTLCGSLIFVSAKVRLQESNFMVDSTNGCIVSGVCINSQNNIRLNGSTRLFLAQKSRYFLEPNSVFLYKMVEAKESIFLAQGAIFIQSQGPKDVVWETAQFRYTMLGTVARLQVKKGKETLEVLEGGFQRSPKMGLSNVLQIKRGQAVTYHSGPAPQGVIQIDPALAANLEKMSAAVSFLAPLPREKKMEELENEDVLVISYSQEIVLIDGTKFIGFVFGYNEEHNYIFIMNQDGTLSVLKTYDIISTRQVNVPIYIRQSLASAKGEAGKQLEGILSGEQK